MNTPGAPIFSSLPRGGPQIRALTLGHFAARPDGRRGSTRSGCADRGTGRTPAVHEAKPLRLARRGSPRARSEGCGLNDSTSSGRKRPTSRRKKPASAEAGDEAAAADLATPSTGPDAGAAAAGAADASETAPPRRRRRAAKAAPPRESEATPRQEESVLAADELPESERITPIDEEMLEAIRREVTADRQGEDELYALAASIAQEEDEVVEDEIVAQSGPLFVGPVPLDTPEERLAAMHKAAQRLGISRLYPEQERVIDALLARRDVLMVLPTGFGKSRLLPDPVADAAEAGARASRRCSRCSKDQYEKLRRARRPVRAPRRHGARQGARERARARSRKGGSLLVMTTPETLGAAELPAPRSRKSRHLARRGRRGALHLGVGPRLPPRLPAPRRAPARARDAPPLLALTATATEQVRDDIVRFLGMREPAVVATLAAPLEPRVRGAALREAAHACARSCASRSALRRPGIVYCSTTRDGRRASTRCCSASAIPAHRYHGKMTAASAPSSKRRFMKRGPPHRDGRDQRVRPRHRQARHPLHRALPGAGVARAVRAGGGPRRPRRPPRELHPALRPERPRDPRGAALAQPRAPRAALQARPALAAWARRRTRRRRRRARALGRISARARRPRCSRCSRKPGS